MSKEKYQTVNVRVETYDLLKKIAEIEHRPLVTTIELITLLYAKEHDVNA